MPRVAAWSAGGPGPNHGIDRSVQPERNQIRIHAMPHATAVAAEPRWAAVWLGRLTAPDGLMFRALSLCPGSASTGLPSWFALVGRWVPVESDTCDASPVGRVLRAGGAGVPELQPTHGVGRQVKTRSVSTTAGTDGPASEGYCSGSKCCVHSTVDYHIREHACVQGRARVVVAAPSQASNFIPALPRLAART